MSNMSDRAEARKALEYSGGAFREPENEHRFNIDGIPPAPLVDRQDAGRDHGGTPCFRLSEDNPRPWWKRQSHLSASEERDLALRAPYDDVAAQRLVAAHVGLVQKIVVQFKRRHAVESDSDLDAELLAAGCEALRQALPGFDPDRSRFATRAWKWIDGALKKALSSSSSPIRTPRGHKPLIVRSLDRSLRARNGADSFDQSFGALHDSVGDTAPSAEDIAAEGEEIDDGNALIARAQKVLSSRERRIFRARRLADPPVKLTFLAGEFGVSAERVRQIESATVNSVAEEVVRLRGRRRHTAKRKPTLSWLRPRDDRTRAYTDRNFSPETAAALASNRDARLEAAHGLPGACDHYWRKPAAKIWSAAWKDGGGK